uniref:Uncharacterized protein n=1 Tax=Chromera velia CCMP2878 TaxID=1169474 RepID=A0A0G4HA33_9ALVE|eukprot:Cvel_25561.t1-p1 / transcript=Cvel_25561.t1 / gene=Cvel_25561 / organism=Chromera_velia_CCMP2878 / gene_product=hypothetical protein / transcript_product=hypothetical protein / location=Cvel_scaffold2912:10440-11493(+) / protein_length=155 / sequence_SO=supercontig / SO=protein_coding / is_pseudo=false
MPPDDIQTDGLTNPPSPSAQKDFPKRPKSAVLPRLPPPSLPSHSKSLSQTLTNSLGTPPPDRRVAASAAVMVLPLLIPIVGKAPGLRWGGFGGDVGSQQASGYPGGKRELSVVLGPNTGRKQRCSVGESNECWLGENDHYLVRGVREAGTTVSSP